VHDDRPTPPASHPIVMPRHVTSRHITSSQVTPRHVTSRPVTSWHSCLAKYDVLAGRKERGMHGKGQGGWQQAEAWDGSEVYLLQEGSPTPYSVAFCRGRRLRAPAAVHIETRHHHTGGPRDPAKCHTFFGVLSPPQHTRERHPHSTRS
jgi:hypothetical protein